MLKVQINLKSGSYIVLVDTESTDHEKLANQLSELYSIKNVAILKTTHSSVTVRPSDISTIIITPATKQDFNDYIPIESQEKIEEVKPIISKTNNETQIDIITDMD